MIIYLPSILQLEMMLLMMMCKFTINVIVIFFRVQLLVLLLLYFIKSLKASSLSSFICTLHSPFLIFDLTVLQCSTTLSPNSTTFSYYLPWNDDDDDIKLVVHVGLSLEPQRLPLDTPTSSCGSPSDTSSPYLSIHTPRQYSELPCEKK